VKIIRNKQTGYSEGYGFVEMCDRATAEHALRALNGTQMPNAQQNYRLNWASFGVGARFAGGGDGGATNSNDHSIFVGDLPPEVNDFMLQEVFSSRYASVRNARVVTDPATGRSKGFGFVRFADESQRDRALVEMNGLACGSRNMRISLAIPRKNMTVGYQGGGGGGGDGGGGGGGGGGGARDDGDDNCTVFVGGLGSISDAELRIHFEPYGELVYIKIPHGKGCGFVQFAQRSCAEAAIAGLNNALIGTSRVRLSWVRSNPGGGGGGMGMMGGMGMAPGRGMGAMGPMGGPGMGGPMGGAYGGYPGYPPQMAFGMGNPGMGMGMYGGMDPNAYAMYAAAAAAGDQNAGAYMAAAAAQAQARPLPVRQSPFARRAPFLED